MRVGPGDLVLLLAVGLVGPAVRFGVLSDPGLGWHLRTPDVVFQGGFPTADPFSGPSHGNRWLANQWLGDLPFWAGWQAAGWNGVAAVALSFLLVAYRLLYGFLRADGVAWPAAVAWAALAVGASYVAWLARPNMVTLLLVPVLARWLTLFHEGWLSAWRLAWVPPLFAVWVNAHGGFVAGLGTLGLAATVEALIGVGHPDGASRAAARRRAGVLLLTLLGSLVATLANPYGWRVYPWVFALLGDPYFMNLNLEWLSPDFHAPGADRIELLVLLLVGLLAVSRHRPNLVLLAVVLAWLHLALQGRRYTPVWVLVTVPLVARLAADIPWLNSRYRVLDWKPIWGRPLADGWVGGVLAAAGLAGWAAFAPPIEANSPVVPEPGLRVLLDRWHPGEPVFHSPNYGGFLTLHGWPAFRVWIDDRNEVHGQRWYEEFLAVQATAPGWEGKLDGWGVAWVAVAPGEPLAHRLAERPDRWAENHRDAELVLFRRR